MAGNRRFLAGAGVHTNHVTRRDALAAGQSPYAMVLCCSDSRVPPEIIFDQSLGDLFVVRLAGNFADEDGIGSLQYSVAHFASPVLLILGHTSCGAIHATVDNLLAGEPPVPGDIGAVVKALMPAAKYAHNMKGPAGKHPDLYAVTTEQNVRATVAKLKNTHAIIGEALKAGKLQIAGGIYDVGTGRVNLL
jgi:carbonic anhydrase